MTPDPWSTFLTPPNPSKENPPMRDLGTLDVGYDGQLLLDAAREAIGRQYINRNILQRRIRVGFAKALRLLDLLEDAGVVGPPTGDTAGAREVLVPVAEKNTMLERLRALVEAKPDA
jgi:DNA segregation ATPase FtsK/SpoIIIE, S-DNA-T family